MEDRIKKLKEMINVQGRDGNWDSDHYMHGMYNGMVFALSMMDGTEPVYRDAPPKWRRASENISYEKAIKKVCADLKDNEDLYRGFQANIAMAFVDTYNKTRALKQGTRVMANEAAKTFLTRLIGYEQDSIKMEHIGSSFDYFLKGDGIYDEVCASAKEKTKAEMEHSVINTPEMT